MENVMTVSEVAKLLGVSGGRIRQLLEMGKLTGRKADGYVWLIDGQSVERLIEERKQQEQLKNETN